MKRTSPGVPLRFLMEIPLEGEGCLTWPYARTSAGYGHLAIDGRHTLVSRVVCERKHGPAPEGRFYAAHSCGLGHEGCVAPWHISWKTPTENAADKIAHGTHLTGDTCPASKLTSAQVAEIRAMRGTATQQQIGARFGVGQPNISAIFRGRSWRA